MGDTPGRAWLEAQGLVRYFDGRPRVVAGELVAAFDGKQECPLPEPVQHVEIPTWDDL